MVSSSKAMHLHFGFQYNKSEYGFYIAPIGKTTMGNVKGAYQKYRQKEDVGLSESMTAWLQRRAWSASGNGEQSSPIA